MSCRAAFALESAAPIKCISGACRKPHRACGAFFRVHVGEGEAAAKGCGRAADCAERSMPIAGCMTPVLGCVQTRVDLIRTAQANYPERLGLAVVCNPPFLFWALWRSVSPFLDAVTKCAPPCLPCVQALPSPVCSAWGFHIPAEAGLSVRP